LQPKKKYSKILLPGQKKTDILEFRKEQIKVSVWKFQEEFCDEILTLAFKFCHTIHLLSHLSRVPQCIPSATGPGEPDGTEVTARL